MSFTLCTSAAAVAKAGLNANAAVVVNATILGEWSDEVEGSICAITRYDWVTNIASVGANFIGILEDLASDMIAMKIIAYDMSGYTRILEATTMLDLLRDNSVRNLENLKLQDVQEKMI